MKYLYYLAYRKISKSDKIKLLEIYQSSNSYETRIRCHILLLFAKRLSIIEIADILFLENEKKYIKKVFWSWYPHSFNMINDISINEFYNKSNRTSLSTIIINTIKFFALLVIRFIQEISNSLAKLNNHINLFLKYTFGIIKTLILSFYSKIFYYISIALERLKLFSFKKYHQLKSNVTQNASIILKKGASVKNINILNFSANFDKESLQNIFASSLGELQEKLFKILNNETPIQSTDTILAWSIAISEYIQKIKNAERRKAFLTAVATFMAVYIWYHSAIQNGVVIFTFLGLVSLTFNYGQYFEQNSYPSYSDFANKFSEPLTESEESSKNTLILYNTNDTASNNNQKIEKNTPIKFYPKTQCISLTEIGTQQEKFIKNWELDIEIQDYYISEPDGRYHIHVAAYKKIKKAAFQRIFLIDQGYDKTKIIKWNDLYYVSIVNYNLAGVWNSCDIREKWDLFCTSSNSKARIIHYF